LKFIEDYWDTSGIFYMFDENGIEINFREMKNFIIEKLIDKYSLKENKE
jgi:hypothetical protein